LLLLDQKKNRFELTGPGYLIHEAGGYKYRVSHLSFFQVNRFLIEDLLKSVTAGAHGALALDLYSGVGFFTLPLARSFQKVVSVDANLPRRATCSPMPKSRASPSSRTMNMRKNS